jgi:hypothetical protein
MKGLNEMDTLKNRELVKELELAKAIIQLDRRRDELYEELISLIGNKAHELLRRAQNGRLGGL